MADDLTFALLAGMLATVNPCGFAMLPGYLALVVAGDSRAARVGRALLASALMTAGFVLVFGVFGLVSAPLAGTLQRALPVVTIVVGVGLALMGGLLLAGKELFLLLPVRRRLVPRRRRSARRFAPQAPLKPKRGAPNTRITSMLGYGVAFAIASLSCSIGPFLAAAGIALRRGDPFAFLTYAVGMGLVVAVLAIGAALAGTMVAGGLRRLLPYVSRLGGGLLVVTGVYVGYYGLYEFRLYRGDTDPADPVIDAAARVQQVLAEWLRSAGPTALVVALVVLVGAIVVVRRRRSSPPSSPDRSAPSAAPHSPPLV